MNKCAVGLINQRVFHLRPLLCLCSKSSFFTKFIEAFPYHPSSILPKLRSESSTFSAFPSFSPTLSHQSSILYPHPNLLSFPPPFYRSLCPIPPYVQIFCLAFPIKLAVLLSSVALSQLLSISYLSPSVLLCPISLLLLSLSTSSFNSCSYRQTIIPTSSHFLSQPPSKSLISPLPAPSSDFPFLLQLG